MYTVWFIDSPIDEMFDELTNMLPFAADTAAEVLFLVEIADKYGFNVAIDRCEGGE